MKRYTVLTVLAVLLFTACVVWAQSSGFTGTNWNGVISSCTPSFNGTYPDNVISCQFKGDGTSGALILYPNGRGQSILPGQTHWSYFRPGTVSYTVVDDGTCGSNCEVYGVTINAFSGPLFSDATCNTRTGKTLGGGDATQDPAVLAGSYVVNAYRGSVHPVKPMSGNITVMEQ
jgi:hypothetical protein